VRIFGLQQAGMSEKTDADDESHLLAWAASAG
jgi:hypothetical protein